MAFELTLIGILNAWTDLDAVAWVQAVLTLVWTFTFQLSAGQLGWALPAEIGSTRLRQKTICLARNTSNILAVICSTLNNYMINPKAWNFRGYTGMFECYQFGCDYTDSEQDSFGGSAHGWSSSGLTSAYRRRKIAPLTNWMYFLRRRCPPESSQLQMSMLSTDTYKTN